MPADYVVQEVSWRSILDQLATSFLDGATLHLYTNDLTPTPDTVLADLTEATFGGYASVTLTTWSNAFSKVNGDGYVVSPLASFSASGVAPSEVVYGCYVRLGGAPPNALFFAGRFSGGPYPMGAAGDALNFSLTFDLGNPA